MSYLPRKSITSLPEFSPAQVAVEGLGWAREYLHGC